MASRRQGTLLPCIRRPADVRAHPVNRRDVFSRHSGAAVYDAPPKRHHTKHEPAVIHGVPRRYALPSPYAKHRTRRPVNPDHDSSELETEVVEREPSG